MSAASSQVGRLYWNQKSESNPVLESLFDKIGHSILDPILPWNFWLNYLKLLFGGKEGKQFSQIQRLGRGLSGLVVAGWSESEELVSFVPNDRAPLGYSWQEFSDETEAQTPRFYKTLAGATQAVIATRNSQWNLDFGERVGLVFWVHPENYYQELDNYLSISGHRFPGSPSR